MYNAYQMMLANAGMNDPQQNERMQKMMLAQALMGGGASMAQAASRPGAGYGESLAAGMMGGMRSAGDVYDMALRNQMYSNQQKAVKEEKDYRLERDKLEDEHWQAGMQFRAGRSAMDDERSDKNFTADQKYKEKYLQYLMTKANPWADVMGGMGGMEDEQAPPAPTVESATTLQDAEKIATQQDVAKSAARKMNERAQRANTFVMRNQQRWHVMNPDEASEALKLLEEDWAALSPAMRSRAVAAIKILRSKAGQQ